MNETSSKGGNSVKCTSSPHFWWLMGILVSSIIGLLAFISIDKVWNASKLIDYISSASVLLSITFSVFALQYTYISNVQIQHHFENINTSAEKIKSISDSLSKTTDDLNGKLQDIQNKLVKIESNQENYTNRSLSEIKEINGISNNLSDSTKS